MENKMQHACIPYVNDELIDDIIVENASKFIQARANPTLSNWFLGQVMLRTDGKANPQYVHEFLRVRFEEGFKMPNRTYMPDNGDMTTSIEDSPLYAPEKATQRAWVQPEPCEADDEHLALWPALEPKYPTSES